MNKQAVLAAVAAVAVLGGLIWIGRSVRPAPAQCTLEAKICPDGSSVGRTGPRCEFAVCPSASATGTWKTFSDPNRGVSFQYPDSLGTQYISTVDWPPAVSFSAGPFSCTEAGSETARAGKTERLTVEGREYCVTRESEGAAGSVYVQYAYASPKGNRVAILTFSLRFVQCGNYDEPKKSECEAERGSFNANSIADRIMQTVRLPDGG